MGEVCCSEDGLCLRNKHFYFLSRLEVGGQYDIFLSTVCKSSVTSMTLRGAEVIVKHINTEGSYLRQQDQQLLSYVEGITPSDRVNNLLIDEILLNYVIARNRSSI